MTILGARPIYGPVQRQRSKVSHTTLRGLFILTDGFLKTILFLELSQFSCCVIEMYQVYLLVNQFIRKTHANN